MHPLGVIMNLQDERLLVGLIAQPDEYRIGIAEVRVQIPLRSSLRSYLNKAHNCDDKVTLCASVTSSRKFYQEPITWNVQLPHIPVTACP